MPRIAVVDRERFNPENSQLMMDLCPVNRAGTECISIAEDKKIAIDEKTCIGCGICVNRDPAKSITILNLPDELASQPIHRYGQNGFHLYNLPVPQFGKVVGLLGRNGIGKSTALKVLSGQLSANLGDVEKEATPDDLIAFFKGKEAQAFFEQLKAGNITVSYKPQQVDLIPKSVSGLVKDVLMKVDERGAMDSVVKELEIENILDNDISNISGGELQRVAIAACVLKKANVYFFDEPSSFLDIKQRIKISKFIRNLADEHTAVMVVEHDLIILDYMTDITHIMYGKEGVYGIVSSVKTTRNAINTYLSGYLREENMRFRDKPIQFIEKTEERKAAGELQVSWKGIGATLGKFKLDAKDGEIHKDDVIGILGENGIGKTSFVKLLAGVDKPEKGEVDENITVSYKPQYIDTDSELTVAEVLVDAISKYSTTLIAPLQLEPLFERKIKELSGGELQRVAIARCLSQKAGLYLMDEPSAYLDVEQRLSVSKLIGDIIRERGASSLIVDHDLLFLDYLSEKLMVFEGKPAINGTAVGPLEMAEGMNMFLDDLKITFRRDPDSHRPRINKEDSVKDREQKKAGKLYYS